MPYPSGIWDLDPDPYLNCKCWKVPLFFRTHRDWKFQFYRCFNLSLCVWLWRIWSLFDWYVRYRTFFLKKLKYFGYKREGSGSKIIHFKPGSRRLNLNVSVGVRIRMWNISFHPWTCDAGRGVEPAAWRDQQPAGPGLRPAEPGPAILTRKRRPHRQPPRLSG